MTCKKCGAEIPEENKFCGMCGMVIDEIPVQAVPQPQQNQYAQPQQYVQTQIFPEIRPEQRRSHKGGADYVLVIIGLFLTALGWFGSSSVTFIGLLLFSIGALNPPKTNYCDNCNTAKDFSAKTCPKCGKKFSVSVGRVIAGVLIVILGTAISSMVISPIAIMYYYMSQN